MKEILSIIEEVSNEHPYKVIGETDTYSQYNEGWTDACDRLTAIIEQSKQKEPCDGCKHEKQPVSSYPCRMCPRAYTDKYQPFNQSPTNA